MNDSDPTRSKPKPTGQVDKGASTATKQGAFTLVTLVATMALWAWVTGVFANPDPGCSSTMFGSCLSISDAATLTGIFILPVGLAVLVMGILIIGAIGHTPKGHDSDEPDADRSNNSE